MRDTGEFQIEYCLRKMFFENSEKSGNMGPTFAECNFDLSKDSVLKVGIKTTVFSNWNYLAIDLKPFRNNYLEFKLKDSYRGEENSGLDWFENMKD